MDAVRSGMETMLHIHFIQRWFAYSDPAGLGDIGKLRSQIQQTNLVYNDALVTMKHEGFLLWF